MSKTKNADPVSDLIRFTGGLVTTVVSGDRLPQLPVDATRQELAKRLKAVYALADAARPLPYLESLLRPLQDAVEELIRRQRHWRFYSGYVQAPADKTENWLPVGPVPSLALNDAMRAVDKARDGLRPLVGAGMATPATVPPGHLELLRDIARAGRRMTIEDLAGADRSERAVGEKLRWLLDNGFIERDQGRRAGAALTPLGLEVVRAADTGN